MCLENNRKIDISLLIPAHNEELNIVPLVEQIAEFTKNTDYVIEAVIVNDGSTDQTKEKIRECMQRYDFIVTENHRTNMRMTAALVSAFNNSSGRYVIVFPADLQYLPDCIPDLIRPLQEGYDLVAGWKEGQYDKKFISYFYNKISSRIFNNLKVHDLNSVKAMKREVFQTLHLRKDWHRYIVVLAAEMGYKIQETRVKLYPRIHGQSKYSSKSRIVVGIFDLLSVKYLLSFSRKPLLLFGVLGFALICLGVLIGIGEIIARVFFQAGFRPILYLIMLLIMVGVNLFALGFIAELIVMANERIEALEKKIQDRATKSKIHD